MNLEYQVEEMKSNHMPPITSLQNTRVKNAAKLRDRRHREKQGRIRIDGVRELGRALEAGVRLVEVFVCPKLCQCVEAMDLLSRFEGGSVEVIEVTEPVFAKLAFGDRIEGLLGVAETPEARLENLDLPNVPLVVVLESVEKPGNVGAVARSADAAGVSALVVADARTDLFNPNAIRASLGTLFTIPVATASAIETLDWLRLHGLNVLAARADGSIAYTEVDYQAPTALVFGSEATGLSEIWTGDDIRSIHLPLLGVADSLNVSVTAAVIFYEALRQRKSGGF